MTWKFHAIEASLQLPHSNFSGNLTEAYNDMHDAGAIGEDPVWSAEDILLIERAKELLLG
jgi:hypothetical protein